MVSLKRESHDIVELRMDADKENPHSMYQVVMALLIVQGIGQQVTLTTCILQHILISAGDSFQLMHMYLPVVVEASHGCQREDKVLTTSAPSLVSAQLFNESIFNSSTTCWCVHRAQELHITMQTFFLTRSMYTRSQRRWRV